MRASPSPVSFVLALVVGCGPQVVLDFETNGDSGDTGDLESSSGAASSTSVASTTATPPTTMTMTAGPDPSVGDETGPAGPYVCTHHCVRDADCAIEQQDVGLRCLDGTCGSDLWDCASDEECVAVLTGWAFTPCTAGGGECSALGDMVCVDLGGGSGGCASLAGDGSLCAMAGWGEVVVTELGTGRLMVACGFTDGICHADGWCVVPCSDDLGCGGLDCNPETGACECSDDAQCVAIGLETGVCIDRACNYGCAADTDCDLPFDGGVVTCGPP